MSAVSGRQVIAGYFNNQAGAERAIGDLHRAGFRSEQIGCSYEPITGDVSESGGRRSFWDKVENFFGAEREPYDRPRDVGATSTDVEGRYSTDPVVPVPDRYRDRLAGGGCLVTVEAGSRVAEAEDIIIRCGGEVDREFATAVPTSTSRDVGTAQHRIRLLSEVLRVNKERVQMGEVRLRKEVRTETQNIEVPVTHEEIVIERVPTEGRTPATGEVGTDQEIRVPLSEERVKVEKNPVVREEVRVGKRQVQETETVSDQVRHEELKVNEENVPKRKKGPGDKAA